MARRISTNKRMTFEKFKDTFGPTLDMSDSPKKDQFLVSEWKRNMTEIAAAEEKLAQQKLELDTEIKSVEKKLASDEEQE